MIRFELKELWCIAWHSPNVFFLFWLVYLWEFFPPSSCLLEIYKLLSEKQYIKLTSFEETLYCRNFLQIKKYWQDDLWVVCYSNVKNFFLFSTNLHKLALIDAKFYISSYCPTQPQPTPTPLWIKKMYSPLTPSSLYTNLKPSFTTS